MTYAIRVTQVDTGKRVIFRLSDNQITCDDETLGKLVRAALLNPGA
jgi:phosphoribosylformylglycinamidine (FGAM) synthase PurS component